MSSQLLAKLFVGGVIPAHELSKASRLVGTSLEEVLTAIESLGFPRSQVYSMAVKPPEPTAGTWQTFTLEEAIEVLYNRAASTEELAAKLGRSKKAVQNFRWRAFRQGFLVPKRLWEALENGKPVEEWGWRAEFAKMLKELIRYANLRKLQPPKVVFTED